MPEIIRLSGYRLQGLSTEQMSYKWAALRFEVQKYVSLFQQMDMGHYLDDGDRNVPPLELLMSKLQSGELYIVHNKGKFIGISAITNIAYGRHAFIEAIAVPEFRGSYAVGKSTGELLTYAFNPYGDGGLGLKKLYAKVATANMQVVNMLKKAGFNPAGLLKGEGLYMGVPQDMILLELLNPTFFAVDTKVISNVRSTVSTSLSSDQLRNATTASTITISNGERSSSDDAATDRAGGTELRADITPVATVEQLQWDQQSFESGRSGWTVRPESDEADVGLVHPERSTATSEPEPSAIAEPGTKLRNGRSSNGGADPKPRRTRRVPSSTRS